MKRARHRSPDYLAKARERRRQHRAHSIKVCACGKRAPCKDSRAVDDYVRRRYRCECGRSWTTAEFIIGEGDARQPQKVAKFWQRIRAEAATEATAEMRGQVAAILGLSSNSSEARK